MSKAMYEEWYNPKMNEQEIKEYFYKKVEW
jgi:hypothetical protein